jgi:toxin FitB
MASVAGVVEAEPQGSVTLPLSKIRESGPKTPQLPPPPAPEIPMNQYLLETNVVSELRKRRLHGAVLAWIRELQPSQLQLSAVTIGELQTGIELTRPQDPTRAADIELWLDQLTESFEVIPMDGQCLREWARLMGGKTDRLLEAAMIAATAAFTN